MSERRFTAPTPPSVARLARNLRRRGYTAYSQGRRVRVALDGDGAALRLVAQRYAAVEVTT